MAGCTAVLVGAGSGTRLGSELPKAFVCVGGVPLLARVVRTVVLAKCVDDVVVVVGSEHRERAETVLRAADLPPVHLVAGGRTRADSVAAGLAAVSAGDGVVAVHDVARALVPVDVVDRAVAALKTPWSAVAPALPVADTLKLVGPDDRVIRTVDRRGVWAVQTPLVFGVRTLRSVLERIDHGGATDELTLVEQAGGRVRVVPGDPRNFKITYPADLVVAEALVATHA